MSGYSATSIYAMTGSLLGLTVASAGLRVWARRKHDIALGIDDGLMLVALTSFIGIAAITFEYVHIGGIGVSSLPADEQLAKAATPLAAKLQVSLTFLSILCLGCTKASICFLYRRIFCIRGSLFKTFNQIVVASVVIVLSWMTASLILFSQSCHNHWYALWETQYLEQYCSDLVEYLWVISIMDVILDAWVLVLPIVPVFSLHVNTSKKISISGVFLLAAGALGASIARLVIYTQIYKTGLRGVAAGATERYTSRVYFYFILECGISVIAINLPITGPLVVRSNLHALTRLAQSVTSLASKSSSRSRQTDSNPDRQPSTSREGLKVFDANTATESYVVRDMSGSIQSSVDGDRNHIHVHETISVSRDPEKN